MVYIGYPVYYEEAFRLFNPQLLQNGCNEPSNFESFLPRFTSLRIHWIDKGVWILGVHLESIDRRYWKPLLSVEDAIIGILEAKKHFVEEVKRIQLNTSVVEFAYMEDGEEIVYNPEPAVFF